MKSPARFGGVLFIRSSARPARTDKPRLQLTIDFRKNLLLRIGPFSLGAKISLCL
jgi:hypothetical protein